MLTQTNEDLDVTWRMFRGSGFGHWTSWALCPWRSWKWMSSVAVQPWVLARREHNGRRQWTQWTDQPGSPQGMFGGNIKVIPTLWSGGNSQCKKKTAKRNDFFWNNNLIWKEENTTCCFCFLIFGFLLWFVIPFCFFANKKYVTHVQYGDLNWPPDESIQRGLAKITCFFFEGRS